jgi:hypothetical protein
MVTVGVRAEFEFKAGQEAAAQDFFDNGRLVVETQPGTTRWYAFQVGPTTYGAFAVFADEADRDALLAAGGPQSSRTNADLFERPPTFEKVDIIASRDGG